jgi:hypothetical protein
MRREQKSELKNANSLNIQQGVSNKQGSGVNIWAAKTSEIWAGCRFFLVLINAIYEKTNWFLCQHFMAKLQPAKSSATDIATSLSWEIEHPVLRQKSRRSLKAQSLPQWGALFELSTSNPLD